MRYRLLLQKGANDSLKPYMISGSIPAMAHCQRWYQTYMSMHTTQTAAPPASPGVEACTMGQLPSRHQASYKGVKTDGRMYVEQQDIQV